MPRRPVALVLAGALLTLAPAARAEGLRVSLGGSALNYRTPEGQSASLYVANVGTRVSRGRAGMTFSAPLLALSGGRIALSDQNFAVTDGEAGWRAGLGDVSAGLDYNIVQDRERRLILTLGGSVRFPTGSTAMGMSAGEHLLGLGLSAVYGLTREVLLFAEARRLWVGILSPLGGRAMVGELGSVWWFRPRIGLSGSLLGADYAGRVPASLEVNLGLLYEVLPGMMVNLGAVHGFFGAAPRLGGSLGTSFEL